MFPEIEPFTKEHFITELYVSMPVDEQANRARINDVLYEYLDNEVCEDEVIVSTHISLSSCIYAEPDPNVRIDTVEMPQDYLESEDFGRIPSSDYIFIHKNDSTEIVRDLEKV